MSTATTATSSSDGAPQGASLLYVKQREALKIVRDKMEHWTKFKKDYEQLRDKLNDLQKETRHEIMVPICGKNVAFMPGFVQHTNEILVLLGDNYFVQRSTTQANDIIARRIKHCDEMLEGLKKEKENLENWMKYSGSAAIKAGMVGEDLNESDMNADELIEITEEYDEEKERQWKEEHRRRVKEHHAKLASERAAQKGGIDEEIERRLSQLEELELGAAESENFKYDAEAIKEVAVPIIVEEELSPKPKPILKRTDSYLERQKQKEQQESVTRRKSVSFDQQEAAAAAACEAAAAAEAILHSKPRIPSPPPLPPPKDELDSDDDERMEAEDEDEDEDDLGVKPFTGVVIEKPFKGDSDTIPPAEPFIPHRETVTEMSVDEAKPVSKFKASRMSKS